jgi:hypothetical protein
VQSLGSKATKNSDIINEYITAMQRDQLKQGLQNNYSMDPFWHFNEWILISIDKMPLLHISICIYFDVSSNILILHDCSN